MNILKGILIQIKTTISGRVQRLVVCDAATKILKRIIGKFRNYLFEDEIIGSGPIIHNFPELGVDGQVTIDCIVRPTARPSFDDSLVNKNLDGGRVRITPQRVGAMFVEVDEYGLRFRWEPTEMLDKSFTSPFSFDGRPKPNNKATNNGGNDDSV